MAKLKERYANALMELTEESSTLENDLKQVIMIRDALSGTDVQAFLEHPHIPNSAKYELFDNAFSGKLADHLMGFLHLMVRKSRESLIVLVLEEYIERTNKRLGKVEAKVVSAKELTKEQIENIRNLMSRKLHRLDRQIDIKTTVDPDVIGGFYILIDGHIFDGTVRTKLINMREHLKRGSCE